MEFLSPEIDKYVVDHTEKETEVLHDLNRQTHLQILNPRMLAGAFQGRVLSMLSNMISPKNILEIGTYTGYSAICWSEGLQPGGKIITIDINEEIKTFTEEHLEKAGISENVTCIIGNAMEVIPTLTDDFDVVFIDADKSNYSNYYDLVIDRMKPGSYIIADNVLWSGKVIDGSNDVDTVAIKAFNKKVLDDDRVQNVLFPIRDGLMISRKL